MRVTVHTLATDRYFRPQATADFSLEVLDRATGRTLYTERARVERARVERARVERARVERAEGNPFSMGLGGSMIEELRVLVPRVQNEAIDQPLNKPGFLAAVRPSGGSRTASRT